MADALFTASDGKHTLDYSQLPTAQHMGSANSAKTTKLLESVAWVKILRGKLKEVQHPAQQLESR